MEKLKAQLNFGSIAGIIAFVLFLTYYYLGYNPFGNIRFLSVWVPVLFIYKTIKKVREDNNGFITYGSALQNGIFFSFIYSSFSSILVYLFALVLPNNLVERQIMELNTNLVELEKLEGMFNKETYNLMLNSIEIAIENTNIRTLAWSEFQFKLMGGMFISLIISFILKKKPSPFEDQANDN
jgi:hypothetical protein